MAILIKEIGFDFDGVIADTAETFIRLACNNYNYCSFTLDDIISFEVENCLNIPRDVVERIFIDILIDSIATGLRPMSGAIETLEQFTKVSLVTIITARSLDRPVIEWLARFLSPSAMEKIRVVATGNHDDKVHHIHRYGLKYFIDDRVETCKQLMEENIIPFVFSQPWNKDRHGLRTVVSWDEIRALVA